jgi:hypothetical protein
MGDWGLRGAALFTNSRQILSPIRAPPRPEVETAGYFDVDNTTASGYDSLTLS